MKPTLQTDNLFELVLLVAAQLQPRAGLVFVLPKFTGRKTIISSAASRSLDWPVTEQTKLQNNISMKLERNLHNITWKVA